MREPSPAARILIADDHELLADGCKRLLEPEFQVVGIVTDGRSLMAAAAALNPDIILLDIYMPHLNGLDAGEQIHCKMPWIKLVFMTMSIEPDLAAEAFRRGASGYVDKPRLPANSCLLSAGSTNGHPTSRRSLPGRPWSSLSIRGDLLRQRSALQQGKVRFCSYSRKE